MIQFDTIGYQKKSQDETSKNEGKQFVLSSSPFLISLNVSVANLKKNVCVLDMLCSCWFRVISGLNGH